MAKNSKTRMPATMAELWPMWAGRRGWPDVWQAFGGAEMKVEEFREGDEMVVRAELPGVDPDTDIDVTVKDGALRIHARRVQESKHEDDTSYRSEFQYGSLTRALPLPAGATSADVKASYHDGILEVRVPVDEHTAAEQKVAISRS